MILVRALEGDLLVKGPEGERTIPALKFFKDYLFTTLDPQEVVAELGVPRLGSNTGWSYKKVARRSQDWAIVGVAAVVEKDTGSKARPASVWPAWALRSRERGRGRGGRKLRRRGY